MFRLMYKKIHDLVKISKIDFYLSFTYVFIIFQEKIIFDISYLMTYLNVNYVSINY